MTVFRFKAVDAGGEVSEGQLEAASREAAVQRLQAQGYLPIRVEARPAPARDAAHGAHAGSGATTSPFSRWSCPRCSTPVCHWTGRWR